ncbi:hypothetical protein HSX44_03805 [Wolbachia endosymbiont of Onchocerca gibsoni]|uniref:hypothetical protein n=1 Tax=Wolbachia endosymbiont of Onchocerca gibsoni TaxID=118986 RepID=UPI0023D849D6|nr:hypothetical protein [Wolbachia endosymbiont of Onchocerca gibsoni]MDF0607314.1 hypothetical protein [Wolbachia endosymbiont of Onchocerca gibsoni]MDF0607976.1 hypothetical protein [Wolbachia endosymbiont of Onchocerca gibsoni]
MGFNEKYLIDSVTFEDTTVWHVLKLELCAIILGMIKNNHQIGILVIQVLSNFRQLSDL